MYYPQVRVVYQNPFAYDLTVVYYVNHLLRLDYADQQTQKVSALRRGTALC